MRFFKKLTGSIRTPRQMYGVGLLFGLGFDTATEVAFLVLAGTGAASGLPWYAILTLPVLFAAGMSLLRHDRRQLHELRLRLERSANPVRKVYYNITITGLSITVALLIGTVELVGLLGQELNLTTGAWGWIEGLNINTLGFFIVGLFVVTWALAVGVWRAFGFERCVTRVPRISPKLPSNDFTGADDLIYEAGRRMLPRPNIATTGLIHAPASTGVISARNRAGCCK